MPNVPVLLDENCENVVVFRTHGMSSRMRHELHVGEGEINFSRVYAKSGSGREDVNNLHSEDINDEVNEDAF